MASPTYLLRLNHDELRSVQAGLLGEPDEICTSLGYRLGKYLTPYTAGHCADCGNKLEAPCYVSPESVALTEVVLDGFKAIQAEARVVCTACYRLAFERVNPGSASPI